MDRYSPKSHPKMPVKMHLMVDWLFNEKSDSDEKKMAVTLDR